MKIAYFDCPTGIAGDMCLGALVDGGVPLSYLSEQLQRLAIRDEFHLHSALVKKEGIQGTQVLVHLHETTQPVLRLLPEIEQIIREAGLPQRAETWAIAIFRALAVAEGAVHGVAPEQVHFHEVGAVDAIVDIVGTCLGLDWLGIERIVCSPLPFGGGTVQAAHGRMPVPTPAVIKLWQSRNVPIFSNGIPKELVTPTGAAIVCALAESFGACPPLAVQAVGLGAGERNIPIPNLLRLWIGQSVEGEHAYAEHSHHEHGVHSFSYSQHHHHEHPASQAQSNACEEVVAQLETQLDDVNPQVVGYLFEQLQAEGALDVYVTSVGMKKNRPGFLVTVLCPPQQVSGCEEVLFRETTTLGVRRHYRVRSVLGRRFETVETPYGRVPLKIGFRGARVYTVQPEYEDCRTLAQVTGTPLKVIQGAALRAYREEGRL
ncbi:nickel pincer cofactor biosynthesis protein LarC [Anthocerotibacter panamensis]|uniref:nickel pincer cofactor biosynthesis protein LarC n=1 Tax=Anthocerotibacter panamensis TaxID=2857077 RepID=UPI001C401665|nr:nickel pincer cofactor biosynthesis protein LarC [Anthocerotibacter panamensis]